MHLKSNEVLDRSKKAFARKEQWRTIYEDCYRYRFTSKKSLRWLL